MVFRSMAVDGERTASTSTSRTSATRSSGGCSHSSGRVWINPARPSWRPGRTREPPAEPRPKNRSPTVATCHAAGRGRSDRGEDASSPTTTPTSPPWTTEGINVSMPRSASHQSAPRSSRPRTGTSRATASWLPYRCRAVHRNSDLICRAQARHLHGVNPCCGRHTASSTSSTYCRARAGRRPALAASSHSLVAVAGTIPTASFLRRALRHAGSPCSRGSARLVARLTPPNAGNQIVARPRHSGPNRPDRAFRRRASA